MDKITKIVSKYLDGDLNNQELHDFEIQLENNNEYREELEFQEDMFAIIGHLYGHKTIEKEIEEKNLTPEIQQMIDNSKNKTDKSDEIIDVIDEAIDNYEQTQHLSEIEVLESNIKQNGLDNEIEQMINKHSEKELDLELSDIVNDSIDQYEKENSKIIQIPKNKTIKLFNNKYFYISAAAVATIIITFGIIIFNSTNQTNQKIASSVYHKPTANLYLVRSTNMSELINDSLESAVYLYENKKYQVSIEEFKEIIEKNPQNKFAVFYLAMAYYEIKNYEEAIRHLKSHIISFSENDPNINWFLGICYLQIDDTEKAKEQFEIIKSSNTYKDEIAEIMKKIN